jgi:predicted metal-dependent HD superfamily phosphohydrolase
MSTLEGWLRSWAELSIPASGKLQELFTGILSRYAEPHRYYHTRQHREECFEKWSDLRGQADHPAEVDVALWFHDAVYDTNEYANLSAYARYRILLHHLGQGWIQDASIVNDTLQAKHPAGMWDILTLKWQRCCGMNTRIQEI